MYCLGGDSLCTSVTGGGASFEKRFYFGIGDYVDSTTTGHYVDGCDGEDVLYSQVSNYIRVTPEVSGVQN